MNKNDLICDLNIKYNNFYNYSLFSENINWNEQIDVICPVHGIFKIRVKSHLWGSVGCYNCKIQKRRDKYWESLLNQYYQKYGNKYDYSMSTYIDKRTPINIICRIHGVFKQLPRVHLISGCNQCCLDKKRSSVDDFVNNSKLVHGDYYDYSLVEYKKSNKKVKIICPKHGLFEQTPNGHLSGRGCQKCNMSKGETNIKKILEENNVKYIHQKIFKNCKNISYLPFDFYLPIHNLCVEYDGIQHFEPIRGELSLLNIIKNDKIKDEFCKNNNIKLLRIKFDENIENKLKNNI